MSNRGDRGRGRGGPPRGDFRGGGRGSSPGRGSPDSRGRGGPPRGGFQGGGGRGGGPGGIFRPGPVEIDARLRDGSQDEVLASLRSLTLGAQDLPVRPDFGTSGRAIKLRANFFPVKVPKGPLYEYDVTITPKAKDLARRLKQRIFQLAEQTPEWAAKGLMGFVAHDNSAKLIAARKLPQPLSITVPYYDEDEEAPKKGGKQYTLEITFIQLIDTGNLLSYLQGDPQYRDYDIMPVISALNVILAAYPNRSGGSGVMVGRNRWFFKSPNEPAFGLGGGLEAWRGFYSSVRPAHGQLMVNVNVCTTAFYTPGNLADALLEARRSYPPNRLGAFIKGVRVVTKHLGYKKTIKTLSNFNAQTYSFKVQEFANAELTVEQYFFKKYNIKLRYPQMPLVDLGGQKTNLIPAELCDILPNQSFKGKLSDEQTAEMIKVAAKPPNLNANAIVGQGLGELGFRGDNELSKAFDVAFKPEMAVVPARLLAPPSLQYGQGRPEVDERASWNLRNVKFHKGATLSNWAILVILDGRPNDEFQSPKDAELKKVWTGFKNTLIASGLRVTSDPTIATAKLPPKDKDNMIRIGAIQAIRNALITIRPKPELVLVILSNGDKHVYSGLKKLCDCDLDVATVCVHSSKIRKERGQLQYFANVGLKINMKLGGANHILDRANMAWLKERPTMLVGIDVTHPGPGSIPGTPSIAAVVASCDIDYAQYPCSIEIQESKKEMVTNLSRMMTERLKFFQKKNDGRLPERVLVYRDGVSEGQFRTVIEEELPEIKKAFRGFDGRTPYMPQLTIVICGKRHHTRFYPTDAADGDNNGNPRPGTVVDRGVTAIYHFDFFLQAHGGLQGTTRPTHYYVVYDDIKFKADQLQNLTNSISYLFARATKAVSLASPAYYADLACERGRCYLHSLLQGVREGSTRQSSSKEEIFVEAARLWGNGVGARLRDTMFYL